MNKYVEFGKISAAWTFDKCGSHPRIKHDQLYLQIVSNKRLPFLTDRVELLDFSRKEQFFSNVEQCFFMVCVNSVVRHALDPHQSSLLKHPFQQISNDCLVAVLSRIQSLIAEEIERAREDGSGVVETLHAGCQCDSCTCLDSNFIFLVFGESRSLSSD